MSKKITNRKVVLISATAIVVVLILGFTLALWSRNFTQSGTNTITTDCFNIEYSESDATSLVNAYPQTDEDGLKNVSYDVTIENTCNTVTNYSVVLNELSTNTLSESHVKVAINDSYKMLNTYESATPSADVDNASSARLLTQGVLGPEQERTISIKSWMDENTTEVEGENKTFGYKITIEALAGANDLLASKIFATNKYNSVAPTTNAFKHGEPTPNAGLSGATYKEYTKNYTTYLTSDNDKTVGSGYTFNKTTGIYTLKNTVTNVSYSTSYIGYYTCSSNNSECVEMYKINAVDGTSVIESTQYKQTGSISGSGLFSAPDNEGTSYYLRGEINNNYVSFANKLWKIIRINGDGTIRLISDFDIDNSIYNNVNNDKKYVGYTYDNSKICTNASPCDGTEGTSIKIKETLDNWYTSNLSNYDNKIAINTYCNDTTYTESNGVYTYGSKTRVTNGTPSLECPDTSENYGGVYRLKIGLISADEAMMIGYSGKSHVEKASPLNYLYTTRFFWAGSPVMKNANNSSNVYIMGDYLPYTEFFNNNYKARPVINLVANVKVASGNGTQSTPYVIDMN